MDSNLIAIVLLALGIALGAVLAGTGYLVELRRISAFLRGRDRAGNGRVAAGAAPGVTDLAEAINAELDSGVEAHIEALRRQQEFKRDLSALSHDIRTPLTGAKGYLQLASTEEDPAARARHLEAAASRIDATTELLDQLFAYTKSTDPDLALEPESVSLKPFVEEVLLAQYPAFEERGWEPAISFEDDLVAVEADREALARILQNLVVNALRHGSGAPEVSVRREGGRVALRISNAVADPGTIDAARLFDRFYQAAASRGASGSGLGLAIAANLARAMGMDIAAKVAGDVLAITLRMRPLPG